jgi:HEAT repeat protein
MSVIDGLFLLVGSSLALWLVLLGLAVLRKLRRDRRESRSVERRAHYAAVLAGGDVAANAELFDAADGQEARTDLAVAIDLLHGSLQADRFAAIGRGMEASSLQPELVADLRARRAITRARAAFLLSRPGTAPAVEQIAPLMIDPDPDVRLVACSGLGRAARRRAADRRPLREGASGRADHRAARSAVGGEDDRRQAGQRC